MNATTIKKLNWFNFEFHKKALEFIGKPVQRLLVAGIFVGFVLFAVEFLFAYSIQLFLSAIGVMDSSSLNIPDWIPRGNLTVSLIFIFCLGATRALLQALQPYLSSKSSEEFRYSQNKRILKWAFFSESASSSTVIKLYNDCSLSGGNVVLNLQVLFLQVTTLIMIIVALFYLSAKLAAISLISLCVVSLPLRWIDRKMKDLGHRMSEAWSNTNSRLLMGIRNLLLVQIYGTQDSELRAAEESLKRYRGAAIEANFLSGVKFASPQLLGVGVLCLISSFAKENLMISSGILVSYFYLFLRMIQNFTFITQAISSIIIHWDRTEQLAKWWVNCSFDGLKNRKLIARDTSDALPSEAAVSWHLKQVSFSYPNSRQTVLSNLDLKIEPGSAVVITGASGAGKSTLLAILIGILQPKTGEALASIDSGKTFLDIDLVKPRVLKSLGYVGPESFLLEGSVKDNLVYGLSSEPTSTQISEALKKAECSFIDELSGGLSHRLTEQGHGLSAGQKQRLSLARALLRNPRALILDEATANLDYDTEKRLVETLKRLKGDITLVIATHREALLNLADQVVKL